MKKIFGKTLIIATLITSTTITSYLYCGRHKNKNYLSDIEIAILSTRENIDDNTIYHNFCEKGDLDSLEYYAENMEKSEFKYLITKVKNNEGETPLKIAERIYYTYPFYNELLNLLKAKSRLESLNDYEQRLEYLLNKETSNK